MDTFILVDTLHLFKQYPLQTSPLSWCWLFCSWHLAHLIHIIVPIGEIYYTDTIAPVSNYLNPSLSSTSTVLVELWSHRLTHAESYFCFITRWYINSLISSSKLIVTMLPLEIIFKTSFLSFYNFQNKIDKF